MVVKYPGLTACASGVYRVSPVASSRMPVLHPPRNGMRLAKPTAEDILTDLTEEQLDGIRRRVRASIEGIETGKFVEYEGREGLKKLSDGVKARGRKLLGREASGK